MNLDKLTSNTKYMPIFNKKLKEDSPVKDLESMNELMSNNKLIADEEEKPLDQQLAPTQIEDIRPRTSMKGDNRSEYTDVSETDYNSEDEEKQRWEAEQLQLEEDRLAKQKSKYYAIMRELAISFSNDFKHKYSLWAKLLKIQDAQVWIKDICDQQLLGTQDGAVSKQSIQHDKDFLALMKDRYAHAQ